MWYAFFSLGLSKLTQNKDRPFFVRNFYGYFSHQHCYRSCCFFPMQLEVRVKISKRSSAKKRSTEGTFWFKMALSLRLVGFSCKFILIRLFRFRNGKKVNSQEFAAQKFIIATDHKSPFISHRQRNFWNVWLTPFQVFQSNLKYFKNAD